MSLKKIPVTVISGFLGAGKTTLVNHVLTTTRDVNIGVIVNEFGEVGIDGDLIVADEEALIEIRNGCICCTVALTWWQASNSFWNAVISNWIA